MRVLRRPMFRGSVPQKNEGIMDGLVDRKGYQTGSENPYIKEAMDAFSTIEQPQDTDLASLAVSGGLNLMSGRGAGSGTLANVARSYEEPFKTFTTSQATRRAFPSQLKMAAVKSGLEQKFKMDQLIKKNQSNMQKEFSNRRNYNELYKKYTDPKLAQGFRKSVGQIFPDAMAEYGSFILDNKNQIQSTLKSPLLGIVPHKVTGDKINFNFEDMVSGGIYFAPDDKKFYQKVIEDDRNFLISYDTYTLQVVDKKELE